jgi:hypothetical protein
MARSTTSTTTTATTGDARARRTRAAAPQPTGANVPTEPPSQVDPELQQAMEQVRPAAGFVLVTLLLAADRHETLGLPAESTALLEAAFLRVLAMHPSDDDLARDYPVGSVVVASLEGIAPLLSTRAFLLPADRIMGAFPVDDLATSQPFGFE